MKTTYISTLQLFLIVCDGLYNPVTRIAQPHVETYWESWDSPGNFVSELSDVPVTPIGSTTGLNIVNLAFADIAVEDDYACLASSNCITSGFEMFDSAKLHEAVKAIHEAGGFVKMAFGGETYGNFSVPMDQVDLLVNRIVNIVDEYNLDGVDLTTVWDCGDWMLCSFADPLIQLIQRLRVVMPKKIISYTFPYLPLSRTYSKVINASIDKLDYVTMSQGSQKYVDDLLAMNVPKHKIVWGQILWRDCGMNKTVEAAVAVAADQYGGVMTWSINADTYQRYDGEEGTCTDYQTGHTDAAYVNTISYILNHYY